MASVWKRLQRVNKKAAKYQFTASYHRIDIETTSKWKPSKLSIVWTRRSRRVVTEPLPWEPSLKDPYKGSVIFPVPENKTIAVTLFKDSRTNEFEDKEWTFVIEDVSPHNKRRRVAWAAINLRPLVAAGTGANSHTLTVAMTTTKLAAAAISVTVHSVLLREGHAYDEDMQSLASLMSVNNNSDIAVLEDLDEDDISQSDNCKQMSEFTHQLKELTLSLTGSSLADNFDDTPDQVDIKTLNEVTPTADSTHPTDYELQVDHINDINNSNHVDMPSDNQEKLTENSTPEIEPKYTSTPTQQTNPNDIKLDFKPLNFKPITVSKFNLKPLELKPNLNLSFDYENDNDNEKTPVIETFNERNDDKTPVNTLLEWCINCTSEYEDVNVYDLAASWKSGLAFCALIHHHRPDLIDFSSLDPLDFESNLKSSFEASNKLGIPPVLTVAEVMKKAVPDRLAIMTYLFQLRAHFTNNELQVEQLGTEEFESSYLVGRHDTDDGVSPDLFRREVSMRRSKRSAPIKIEEKQPLEKASSPTAIKDVRDMFLHQSKTILGKVLSPTRESKPFEKLSNTKWFTDTLNVSKNNNEPIPTRPEKLMTRKELTDPFGSDDEEDHQTDGKVVRSSDTESPLSPLSPLSLEKSPELPKPTPQLLSRHDELKEKARQLLEATKKEARDKERSKRQSSKEKEDRIERERDSPSKKVSSEEERQAMLRERARRLIADARAGIVSPTLPISPSRRSGMVEIISQQSVLDEIAAGGEQIDLISSRSPSRSDSLNGDDVISNSNSPIKSFSEYIDKISPDKESKERGSYLAGELKALEREQQSIDSRAAKLEKQLRDVMDKNDNSEEEARLLSQWFNLVNKKNALIRRQMQLNILEQEEDLNRRCELLARELRLSVGVDEWRKTPSQKRRERLLLQELVEAVNERDRLVQEMDEQEKAIADDNEIERNLSQVELQRKSNCLLQ